MVHVLEVKIWILEISAILTTAHSQISPAHTTEWRTNTRMANKATKPSAGPPVERTSESSSIKSTRLYSSDNDVNNDNRSNCN